MNASQNASQAPKKATCCWVWQGSVFKARRERPVQRGSRTGATRVDTFEAKEREQMHKRTVQQDEAPERASKACTT